MRAAKAISVYAVGVVILGALLAPWAFWLVHPLLPKTPFGRVFDRVLLIVALAGLWPLLRSLQFRSWRDVGFVKLPGWWRHTLAGMAIGVASLTAAGLTLVALGTRSFTPATSGFGRQVLLFVVTGMLVGVLEESFFRGGLLGALRRGTRLWVAVLVSSFVYSAVHFLTPKGVKMEAEAVNWVSGFNWLALVVTNSCRAPRVALGFVTLLLAGWILSVACVRTGALYLSIGLHAGWVVALKCFAVLTDASGPRSWWGGTSLRDNIVVWPVLLVTLAVVEWLCRKKLQATN